MSLQVPTYYAQMYSTNVEMLVQQQGGKLRNLVSSGRYTGSEGARAVNQVGVTKPNKNPARLSDTPVNDISADQRWIYPNEYDNALYITKQDEVKMMVDLKGPYSTGQAEAMGRAEDDEILQAFFADAKTGKNGGTTTSFPAGNIVAVNYGASTNVGLTVPKLRKAKQILMSKGVRFGSEDVYCGVTSLDHDYLLNEIQVINSQYNQLGAKIQDGIIQEFLGIKFVHVEFSDSASYDAAATLVNGSSQRLVPLWAKSGMHLGYWNNLEVKVSERNDKRHALQMYARQVIGATRTQENKVTQILCA